MTDSSSAPARLTILPVSGPAERRAAFHIDDDEQATARPSGFLAAVNVSDHATIGLGRFVVAPRKRVLTQDRPFSLEGKKSRRAAVGLSLRF